MKFFLNRRLVIAAAIVVAQQILLGASTYFISQAGFHAVDAEIDVSLVYISLLFFFALMAYLLSSASAFFLHFESKRSHFKIHRPKRCTNCQKDRNG